MIELENLGANRLHDEIKAERSVLPLFKDFLRDYGTPTVSLLSGAISGALDLIRRAEEAGFTFNLHGQAIESSSSLAVGLNRAFAQRDLMRVCELTQLVASSVDGLRSLGAINFDAPKDAADPAPLRVEIVSQPDRETTTHVERDAAGNITASTQLERDVA